MYSARWGLQFMLRDMAPRLNGSAHPNAKANALPSQVQSSPRAPDRQQIYCGAVAIDKIRSCHSQGFGLVVFFGFGLGGSCLGGAFDDFMR